MAPPPTQNSQHSTKAGRFWVLGSHLSRGAIPMPKNPIALQLYTLREQVAADIVGALRAVAELDTLGLQVAGMHIGMDRLERELDAAIADVRTLGARYIICPSAPRDRRGSAEDFRS